MEKRELKKGEIVQLNPETTKNIGFAGCFMVVTEAKDFGAQGYIPALGDRTGSGGLAYYRAGWDEMEPTGAFAVWMAGND